jgi:hypothetical protein
VNVRQYQYPVTEVTHADLAAGKIGVALEYVVVQQIEVIADGIRLFVAICFLID